MSAKLENHAPHGVALLRVARRTALRIAGRTALRIAGRIVTLTMIFVALSAATVNAQQGWKLDNYAPSSGIFFVEGEAEELRWVGPGDAKLEVIYRPGSSVEAREELSADSEGRIRWTPKNAGLAKLVATVDPKTKVERLVSVSFASTFTLGLVIMVVAALVLFGGAFFSIRALLRAGHRLQT